MQGYDRVDVRQPHHRPAQPTAAHKQPPARRLASPHEVLALQRVGGNRLTTIAVQRQEADTPQDDLMPTSTLTDAQVALFETVLEGMSAEELEAGFVADAESEETDASGDGAQTGVGGSEPSPTAQRVKSLSSDTNPDMTLANLLETKRAKHLPKLVTLTKWTTMKRKMAGKYKGRRKYAAILHQNLQNNAGTSDLVLLLRLQKMVKLTGTRGQHYEAIENKSRKKRQTAQQRTELLGEAAATQAMSKYLPDGKQLIGYASGAGIDQLWVSRQKRMYFVVEAKGPGAKLTYNRFAVSGVGAKGGGMLQMSKAWVVDRVPKIKNQYPQVLSTLLRDCSLKVVNNKLVRNPNRTGNYTLNGLTVTAGWNANGSLTGRKSKVTTYTF